MIREERDHMSSQKSYMGASLVSILLVGAILSAAAANESNKDLEVALEDMQSAHYFAFVMLVRMLNDSIPCNITFLMPNDRMLSNASVPENAVSEFLLRHSIPMPLMFDHLDHFPTGSIIPTYEPGFNLTVSNRGSRRVRLNNVRIIHPNLCSNETSIRCHGIDGVLSMLQPGIPGPSPSCGAAARSLHPALPPPPHPALPPPPHPALPPPHPAPPHPAPAPVTPTEPPPPPPKPPTEPPSPPPKSESSLKLNAGLVGTIAACLILQVVEFRI